MVTIPAAASIIICGRGRRETDPEPYLAPILVVLPKATCISKLLYLKHPNQIELYYLRGENVPHLETLNAIFQ